MLNSAPTPVVVFGCFHHGGLAIVRSLGRLGVPVYAVLKEKANAAYFSRYCHERILWDVQGAAPEESLRFLKGLGERIGRRSILIATSDIGAMFIAQHAERLTEWFIFPEQDGDLIRSVCSKKEMYYLAKKWNVPTPQTGFPRSRRDIEDYLETAQFPFLLKPINSGPGEFRKRLVNTKDELLRFYDSIEDQTPSNLIIQEYIPGGDEMTWTFNGYFDRTSECKVAFTGRKLRNSPPYFGSASLGVCVHNEKVGRMTIDFMKSIGYRGALDLGYRYDTRDGLYKINDINPRIGQMFRLFVGTNGMDVARALYLDMTGQKVPPTATREGRKWIVEDCDWASALRYCRDGNLTFRGWRESLRGIEETSFISEDDPWPLWGAFAVFVRGRLNDLWRLGNQYHRIATRMLANQYQRIATRRTVA